MHSRLKQMIGGCAAVAVCIGGIGSAQAQDFFSQLFGGFSRRVERPYVRMPFAAEFQDEGYGRRPYRNDDEAPRYSGGQAYCVRTCDGRYFPITSQGEQSKAASCNNFCPSSETKVFYGSAIDNAHSDNGQRYADLPNAFKYRTTLVGGCTCNGQNATGLAPVKIEDDPTLRRGDIVAGAEGLLVNRGLDRRGAMNFSPVSDAVQTKYSRTRDALAE